MYSYLGQSKRNCPGQRGGEAKLKLWNLLFWKILACVIISTDGLLKSGGENQNSIFPLIQDDILIYFHTDESFWKQILCLSSLDLKS